MRIIHGDVPYFVEIGRAVAAVDVATRLSVVRQEFGHAIGLMFAQSER
jgi:methionine aminopeptidase